MKFYKVSSRKNGRKVDIVVRATTPEMAFDVARTKYKIKPVSAVEAEPPFYLKLYNDLTKDKKIKYDDLIAAFKQMSFMLNSGISIHTTLEDLVKYTSNERLVIVFDTVLNGVNSGRTLTESFMDHKKVVGGLTISMISLGEKTGNLAESLAMLVKSLEELRDNRAKFKKAMRYPIIVISAMAIAFVALILLVIPQFKSIFAELGANLPLPTRILIGIEEVMTNYGLLVGIGIFVAIMVIKNRYRNSASFKLKFDQYILKVKLIGNIIFLANMNQYVTTLSLLLKAGISLEEGLESSASLLDNDYMKNKFIVVDSSIKRGITLTEAFIETGYFEPMTLQMVNTGEQSGELDKMLASVAEYYKIKYDYIIDNLSAYIEPIMTFFIACLVLLLALGIFLPMWGLGAAAKGGA
ncbi:type II secretion system F family protein [Helicobacter sp. MIT 99-5507]|uniref:type II secretion system F family protein n=1 Tax=Helicobacter sp. MIT 99-5507 TaxID=152489 RepID=UPI000E1F7FF7|nr:type II secretion system F family protein [Helicobacter sp. MIT 99-5507]RDU57444.1 type II secretion system protein F [Helicobacter sp. MIT 99-5507]